MTRAVGRSLLAPVLLALLLPGCAEARDDAPADPAPFAVTKVADFQYPWRIAFLPDGRMLLTEKPGKVWLVTQGGAKQPVAGIPPVVYAGQGGLLGVYVAPTFARDRRVYLTYAEPGGTGSGLALALARLAADGSRLNDLRVIWREWPKGKGGQFGGALAFSPDHKTLFLTVGDRQRMTPAQDPDLPQGKILRLTLDGRPAPGNPRAGRTGAATAPLIDPPRDTEVAKTAPVVQQFSWPGANQTPSETWATGFRTPYGLAFGPDGRLWELEHGPRGGDELNLIEPGRNYGWPLVSFGDNYNRVPIPRPATRPDLTAPVVQWTPVIGPGNLMFYSGVQFPDWRGQALVGGLASKGIERIVFDSQGGARVAARYDLGFRVRDVAQAPDGALWAIADADPGGLYRLVPK
ncbi:PQQ-dependent sugar dehydrogenase [Novosphingobium piscinae]|uniref:PQQ-dependent sugar dehydrogenase n=1 Tax=Novosphingobium piscinae TaxID=1507448 RepID=UPI001C8C1E58